MGHLYKRGNKWWIQYYHGGIQIREKAGTSLKSVAKQLLDLREGEIAQGKLPNYVFDKVKFDDLAEDLVTDYKINKRRSMPKLMVMLNRHLRPFFGGKKVTEITSSLIQRYVRQRLDAEATNATINRELTALKRMMNIGAKQTPPKVDRVPHIQMLKEDNVRKGFFEAEQYDKLIEALPDYLKSLAVFGYRSGWRIKEITTLTWNHVDLKRGIVRLEPGETKTGEGRTLYMDNALRNLFGELLRKRRIGCPYVFHRDGLMIKNYYPAWRKACEDAGVKGMLFHDFRRTAVRNMVRAGVPERIAMARSGHRTRSVFDRYNIVSEDDLKMAAELLEAYLQGK